MKSSMRKIIALLMAVLVLSCVVVGCGGNKPDVSDPNSGAGSDVPSGVTTQGGVSGDATTQGGVSGDATGDATGSTTGGNATGTDGKVTSTTSNGTASTRRPIAIQTNPGGTGGTNPSQGSAGDAFDVGANPVFKENIKNLGGITIKINSPWNDWDPDAASNPQQRKISNALQAIEKDYNVNIEMVTSSAGQLKDVVTAYSAGNVFADM